jgi:hypothetical protein
MSREINPLERLQISSPCQADWDEMAGNEQVRRCGHCHLDVHNLSAMSREEVEALVARSEGRLCVRYVRRPDGSIRTDSPPVHAARPRASLLAAGAFAASLSVSGAARQPDRHPIQNSPTDAAFLINRNASPQTQGGTASLSGTVFDREQAVIARARIVLRDEATGKAYETISDEEGKYQFQSLPGGSYTLEAQAGGFAKKTLRNLVIKQDEKRAGVDFTLEVATMGEVVFIVPPGNLIIAASRGDAASIKKFLAAGDNPDGRGEHGRTALIFASEHGDAAAVRALIAAKADVNAADNDGETALLVGAANYHLEVIQTLLDAHADVNWRNTRGQTALMVAAREGLLEHVKLLLNHGAHIDAQDSNGWTALRYARAERQADVIKALTEDDASDLK